LRRLREYNALGHSTLARSLLCKNKEYLLLADSCSVETFSIGMGFRIGLNQRSNDYMHRYRTRHKIGLLMLLGGFILLGYEIYLFKSTGAWTPVPLSFVGKEILSPMLSNVPVGYEGYSLLDRAYHATSLPTFFHKFAVTTPLFLSLFALGYLLRWERFFGLEKKGTAKEV
jgi:hypothetical protein